MKFINKTLIAALAVSMAAMTSCSDDKDYQPGGESSGCYFETVPSSREISTTESSFTVKVGRSESTNAVSAPIKITDPSGLFSGPATVDFAAGQASADYVITYDPTAIEYDKKYEIGLSLTSDFQYGATTYNFIAVAPAPWTSLGMATFTDNIVSSLYKVDQYTYEVEIQENDNQPGYYRLINPYKNYPVEGVSYDDSQDHHMYIYATNPNQVYFPEFNTGLTVDPSYGAIIAVSQGARYLEAGNPADKIEQAGLFGTLKDGVITFPVEGIVEVEEAEYGQGWYKGNTSGATRIVMPGVSIADYSADVKYAGIMVDPDENKFALADIELGADVESAMVAAVLTNDPQECLTAMLTGKADIVEVAKSGRAEIPVSENGEYVLMVVTSAKGELQDLAYTQFELSLGGKTWNEVGTAYVIDGFILPYLSSNGVPVNPEENPFFVTVEENATTPGIFRLKNMYGMSLVASYVSGTHHIIIDCSDPEWVSLAPQSTGIEDLFSFDGASAAVPYIVNDYAYYTSVAGVPENVVKQNLDPCTFANDVISFPTGSCGKMFAEDPDEGFYNAAKGDDGNLVSFPTTITILRDEASSTASAKSVRAKAPKSIRGIKATNANRTLTPLANKPIKIAARLTGEAKCFRLK